MFRSENKNDKRLSERIEEQEQKIIRYESRLRDVVQAYKSLQKEKEALESTVKALSTSSNSELNRKIKKPENLNLSIDSQSSQISDTLTDPLTQESLITNYYDDDDKSDRNDEIQSLVEKVSTLSKALATVSEEKSKMEAAFQSDKKLAIQEQEKRLRESDEQIEVMEIKYNEVEANIKEMKLRLRQQQAELEAEQTNNSLMLKEMQQLLAIERLEKEELKINLKERSEVNASKSDQEAKIYEMKIQELSDELTRVSSRLKKYEAAANEPSPLLLQLSDEMSGLKKHHTDAICKERKRANEAEETLRQFSNMEEERIAMLETKLTELTEVVGNYEKLRFEDQKVISNLKERLSQIDLAKTNQQMNQQIEIDNDNQTIELKDQVMKLKRLLRMQWDHTEIGFNHTLQLDSEPLSVADLDNILQNDPAHRACQLEYKQLKDEFENYKKENRILRNDNQAKESSNEMSTMIKKSENLESELKELRLKFKDEQDNYNERISCLQCDMKKLEEKHKNEIQMLEENYKGKIMMLELQLTKQRDRTLKLLADKDSEITRLNGDHDLHSPIEKNRFHLHRDNDASFNANQSTNQPDGIEKRSVETEVAVKQLLQRQNSAGSEGSLVYYVQQMSHLQSEISLLRNRNLELENLIRDDEHREEKIIAQMNTLKEEIRKLERNRSRENANLEYVKNIVLRYMMSDSISVKEQLAKAIGVVLQFSPAELHDIHKKQNGWWPSQQK